MRELTRDQKRAKHAYACVAEVPPQAQSKYKTYVRRFGPHVLGSGLAAALAFIERKKSDDAVKLLLKHLKGAGIHGLRDAKTYEDVPARARELDAKSYRLATRETLKVVNWFKRAVQALLREVEEES